MDRTESIAQQHLVHRFPGAGRVVYEPDGNIPPDFLVDGQIAIEVRRLNEHDWNHPKPRGLEELEIPLVRQLRTLINSPDRPCPTTLGVVFHFGRPLPDKKSVKVGTTRFLDELQHSAEPEGMRAEVAPRVHLSCVGQFARTGFAFRLVGWWDDNQGGSILPLLVRNVRICLDNKSSKVRPHRPKYPVWWLMLVDYVSSGADDYDRPEFRDALVGPREWDRVLLVDPLDIVRTLEF